MRTARRLMIALAVLMPLCALAVVGTLTRGAPPYTFTQVANNFASILASPHPASGTGSDTLVLRAGDGAALGTLGSHRVYRVSALDAATGVVRAVFVATGRTSDTLTGVSAVEGYSNLALAAGTRIEVRVTKGLYDELQSAVDDLAVRSGLAINVLADGTVKGDAATDDAAAIQAIIDANPGKTIFFPRTATTAGAISYRCLSTLVVTSPGQTLVGEGTSYDGTVIKFGAPRIVGIDIQASAQGAAVHRLIIEGSERWDEGYLTQGVLPSGWTGSVLADAVTSAADGFRVGANHAVFEHVGARGWGRHGFNLSHQETGGDSDQVMMTACRSANNRGCGWYVQGADSNASTYRLCVAEFNQIVGIYDASFLGNTWESPKTSDNHGDLTGPIAGQAVASLARASNVVTLTFSAPWTYSDAGDSVGGFRIGQGVTVAGMSDTTYNGTFIVHQVVSSTVIKYAMTGSDATPSVVGATAGLAQQRDTWAKAGQTNGADGPLIMTHGAMRTGGNPNSQTVVINLYVEGGQTPTLAGPPCYFGPSTTVIGGINAVADVVNSTPAIFGIIPVSGFGGPGFTGSFPSAYVPKDSAAKYVERIGLTSSQSSQRYRLSHDNSVLWWEEIAPTYWVISTNAPEFDAGAGQLFHLDRTTRNATFGGGLKAGHGATSARPAGLGTAHAGMMFFDTTIGKPVWWSGTGWIDAVGNAVWNGRDMVRPARMGGPGWPVPQRLAA